VLLILVFAGFSHYLFIKTEIAPWLYILIALGFVSHLNEPGRIRFLKSCFSGIDFLKIRFSENLFLVLPFLTYLLVKGEWLAALILLALAISIVRTGIGTTLNFTLPTPFYKIPYEFAVGFRNSFVLLLIAFFLEIFSAGGNSFFAFSLFFISS